MSVYPSAKKKAPLAPQDVSKDKQVQEEYAANPYANPNVYLKAIHGPLSSGLNILNREYQNWPQDLPLLLVHGTADKVCDFKGSKELSEKINAKDKTFIPLEGYYHEMHNEPGEEKVVMINHVTE
mgnify:CR=1 FL=1